MKKQKFSIKNLLFQTIDKFMIWYKHIVKTFTDIKILSCNKINKCWMYKIKYNI